MIKIQIALYVCFAISFISCTKEKKEIEILVAPSENYIEYKKMQRIKYQVSQKYGDEIDLKLVTKKNYNFLSDFNELFKKENNLELAIVTNTNYRKTNKIIDSFSLNNITTVLPISTKIFYILYRKNNYQTDINKLFYGKRVAILSYDIDFCKQLISDLGVDTNNCTFVETLYSNNLYDYKNDSSTISNIDFYKGFVNFKQMPYDIEIGFTPFNNYSSSRLKKFLDYHNYFDFFSIDEVDLLNKGSILDAFCMKNQYYNPFIIPKELYGNKPKLPVLTFRIDNVLIARNGLDKNIIKNIVKIAVENSNSNDMALFGENFKNLNFYIPLNEGTISYLNRNELSIIENYFSLAGKIMSIVVALNTILISFLFWKKKRKKKTILNYYKLLIEYKKEIDNADKEIDLLQLENKLIDIQNNIFNLLYKDRVLIDESTKMTMDRLHLLIDLCSSKLQSKKR